MVFTHARHDRMQWFAGLAVAGALLAGCADPGGPHDSSGTDPDGAKPVLSLPGAFPEDQLFEPGVLDGCRPGVTVQSGGPALLVRDPVALSRFTLERVLQQLIDLAGAGGITPEQLLQRMFDTQNTTAGGVFPDNIHCDTPENRAFKNGAAVDCPRAEGALATSAGLLVPGDGDYLAPVALVNRFDLTPSDTSTCGEYRIVFAKWSGRSDPADRLFLIFEGALTNPSPGDVMACRPVAQAWAALEKESDPDAIAARLEELYFDGLYGFAPVVHPDHFGRLSTEDAVYGATRGQVRLSQRMQDPWEMREMHLLTSPPGGSGPAAISFEPVTVKDSPMPGLFAPTESGPLESEFIASFLNDSVPLLGATELAQIRTLTANKWNGGESALSGPAASDYATQAGSGGSGEVLQVITQQIDAYQLGDGCPPGDPLTASAILGRAAVQSCAGCHAPEAFLGAGRSLGCGLAWPSSLGGAHIDEHGNLSQALTGTFLPRRASVMATLLQGCDINAIWQNLHPVGPGSDLPR